MKKVFFLFIMTVFCALMVSVCKQTYAKSKLASNIDWSEKAEASEGEEESTQEDNRGLDDETYRFIASFNLNYLSFSQDKLTSQFLFFASTHFPEIDSPPPQG